MDAQAHNTRHKIIPNIGHNLYGPFNHLCSNSACLITSYHKIIISYISSGLKQVFSRDINFLSDDSLDNLSREVDSMFLVVVSSLLL